MLCEAFRTQLNRRLDERTSCSDDADLAARGGRRDQEGPRLDAVGAAGRAIRSGEIDLAIAGGVESMTRAPFVMGKADSAFSRAAKIEDTTIGWRFVNPLTKAKYGIDSMPETAENVAAAGDLFEGDIIQTSFRPFEASSSDSQLDKFKEAARELAADEDEARWDERLKKVVKPKPEKPE